MRHGCEQDYFETCIRPLLGRDVEFLGEADTAAKYELLGGAVALLNPIRWPEPFGLVMIEALAAGTPPRRHADGLDTGDRRRRGDGFPPRPRPPAGRSPEQENSIGPSAGLPSRPGSARPGWSAST